MVASMARDAPASSSKALQHSTMNAKLREMKYAVRGEVPIAAERIQNVRTPALHAVNDRNPYVTRRRRNCDRGRAPV
jgi:hypothetical protein